MTRYVNTITGAEERSAKPSEVACPSCGAIVGEKCRDMTRGFAATHNPMHPIRHVTAYHVARRDLAGQTFVLASRRRAW